MFWVSPLLVPDWLASTGGAVILMILGLFPDCVLYVRGPSATGGVAATAAQLGFPLGTVTGFLCIWVSLFSLLAISTT
ncbi:uncharacterized protein K452DRAFT_60869 [Aplosporella prunicola CBS 121167]|uniref:Uncharacterized protein n=1 Tax=Aplosporella prunicola CBS 121167 TaxID=1176127 RepID=A0A6A6AW04_9PEZI|nr:uncharacterized protein K452DRAFT_60869 [Aplosporella prunicola CBS 121167]KAF2135155.1 hypothetical protein K452DRAFT_60869 [Aplosporella prunicola CBS 121167]